MGKLEYRSHFKMPAPQVEQENCVAHNGSIIPVPGRDIFVQAWYQGGVTVVDFTDSVNPVEIAYFDRGPIDGKHITTGGYWSTYWYNGRIYGTEIVRGLDVFELLPSEYVTANEIAAAELADEGGVFNPQQQTPVTWPANAVVARAYMDQLKRADALSSDLEAELNAALVEAEQKLSAGDRDKQLSATIKSLAKSLSRNSKSSKAARSLAGLTETLQGIATRLG